ncbi:hypothetical protein W97_08464 [Coniosporium apollinis CBS 100218]|uniref:Hydrophobin n=1 Tax=Coniosporium apollinis (strain CBS 100218) TaxID=1168221 RepID=R7Z4U3_CONA1|nr:uncharacterized protein W97_08464 [Coniosporium apollinis CBS 100218]EON69205.1 hypothetical protein W97_08464 [Coniosporium apollinis CBS 100218]
MHFTKVFALVAIFATGALAAPVAEADATPPKPVKPVINKPKINIATQTNVCGNGVTPFCCTSDNKGSSSCKAMSQGAICQTTIVCCNAQDSLQVCTGNINVIVVS